VEQGTRQLLNIDLTGNILLTIFGVLLFFHSLIIAGIIPYKFVWGGKIKNNKMKIKMELISIFTLLISAAIVSLKLEYLRFINNDMIISTSLWVLFVLFCFNTLGNLNAKNRIEKYVFGFLTIVISLLILKLAAA
jgi:hypothetical protein